jgi:ribosomal protein S13
VLGLSDDLFLVIHLMIAGRLRWLDAAKKPPARITLAILEFTNGRVAFTEAGTKRRASLHLVRGAEALAQFDRGGLEVADSTLAGFAARLLKENHTLKRALTDPRLFSGIGNAYSDEILHRARLSPLKLTRRVSEAEVAQLYEAVREVLDEWTARLRAEADAGSRRKSPRSVPGWRSMAVTASRVRSAARRSSVSRTRKTSATIARAARPGASFWPIARCHAFCTTAFRARWTRDDATRRGNHGTAGSDPSHPARQKMPHESGTFFN